MAHENHLGNWLLHDTVLLGTEFYSTARTHGMHVWVNIQKENGNTTGLNLADHKKVGDGVTCKNYIKLQTTEYDITGNTS